jgi:transposase
MRRYALRDDQWERIRDLLPGREGQVGVTAKDNRLFVEVVFYRFRAGIAWRRLAGTLREPDQDSYAIFLAGQRAACGRAYTADHEYAMIDSTTVRAHQHGGLLTNPVCPEPRSCAAKDVALANCERLRFATAMLPG